MIMDLPTRYSLESFARVENDKLLIFRSTHFESLMFSITYSLKKRICVYCGEHMNKKTCSLDHRYPVNIGGISIPNNLFPCCDDCNSDKSNFTHEEYLIVRCLPDSEKAIYIRQVEQYHAKVRKNIGFKLPDEWVTFEALENITYHKEVIELRGLKYNKLMAHYSKFGTIGRPAVIDQDNHLLDGYNILFFAREQKIKYIPVVQLENVLYLRKNKDV